MSESRAVPGLVRWDDGKRALFLRPDTGAWVVVEGAGADIIEWRAEGHSPTEISRALAAKYAIAESRAVEDVETYLGQLRSTGLFDDGPHANAVSSFPELTALALHVTARCQLRCRHCYASAAAPRSVEPPLPLLVSAVEQARALGARSFMLTGGDPLERPEVLGALAAPCAGTEVMVLTSAIAPHAELRRLVVELGWRLQISLDGADAATHDWYRGPGAYARVTSNLDALSRDGLGDRVTLSVCLSRVNRDGIEPIIRRAMEWGVEELHVVRVSHHGRAKESWAELSMSSKEWVATYARLAELYARYSSEIRLTGFLADYVLGCLAHPSTRGCHLGRSGMIDLDGRIYPCIMMGQPEHCLGDLTRETLAQCLSPGRMSALWQRCAARLGAGGVCGPCDWRRVCRGACPGWAMVQEGTLQATDGLCDLRRELFPASVLRSAPPQGAGHTDPECQP